MAAGREVVAGVGMLGGWVEISVSGGGVSGWDVDGETLVSVVVRVCSDVVDSLVVVVVVGMAVDAVTVVRVGTGAVVVMVV